MKTGKTRCFHDVYESEVNTPLFEEAIVMSSNKKYMIGFIIFFVLYAFIKISGGKTTYHENDNQYLNRIRSHSTYQRSSSRSSSSSNSGSTNHTSTTVKTTYKPYSSSTSKSRPAKPEKTVDPMDHDIESYYLDYQDEFEDEDDAWDDFEDDPDVWDDY